MVDLEEFSVGEPNRVIRVESQLDSMVKEKLVSFLRKNCDVFTLSHEDMTGISPSMMVHKLNADPNFRLVQQR